jgi:rubrerythrin
MQMYLTNEQIAEIIAEQTKFTVEDVLEEELDHWQLYEMADEVMVDEITDQGRWDTYKRKVFRYGNRFLEVSYSEGSTEMQDYDSEIDVSEVFPKEVQTTIYV